MMLNLEISAALGLVATIEPGLTELESAASEALRMEVDLLRATALALQDDTTGALAIASITLRQSRSGTTHIHQIAATLCRLAYWKTADFEALHSLTRREPGAALDKRRALAAAFNLSFEAAMEFEQLRLNTALRIARDAVTLSEEFLGPGSALAALPASIAAQVLYEGGHFAEAENMLREHLGTLATRGTIETALRTYHVLARIASRRMQPNLAFMLLREAENLGQRRGWLRLTAASLAERVHLLLREAQHEDALAVLEALDRLADQAGGCAAGPSVQRYRVMARSRFELARGPSTSAVAALRQLHYDAIRRRDLHLALQAVLWIVEGLLILGEQPDARSLFDRTLEMGLTFGIYEMFIDSGAKIAQLLPDAYERASARIEGATALLPYIGSLIERWQTYEAGRTLARPAVRARGPLSLREQDVLKLIGSGLTNKQIAQALAITPETVKSHAKSIFVKLAVNTRTEAAMYAQQRGML